MISVILQNFIYINLFLGYYFDAFLSDFEHKASEEDLAKIMIKDILEGYDDTGIKCGCIGEVGCSWPLTGNN